MLLLKNPSAEEAATPTTNPKHCLSFIQPSCFVRKSLQEFYWQLNAILKKLLADKSTVYIQVRCSYLFWGSCPDQSYADFFWLAGLLEGCSEED